MNKQHEILSTTETNDIILAALAERIDRYRKSQLSLIESNSEIYSELERLQNRVSNKQDKINELLAKVDDLAQELAVTQSQLEEARKRLERYEGGGE